VSAFESVARELLAAGLGVRFRASGDSMHPTIRNGDAVDLAPCDASALRCGDIVLARAARGLTLHRIVRISDRGIVMRGDNALRSDAPVAPEDILGRAVRSKQITEDWRYLDGSVKIICFAAAFLRRLRSRFQHDAQS
jgi:hypothetical protein